MKALYIGILTPGTTSRIRADTLRGMLPGVNWRLVDTGELFEKANQFLRSLSFRTKSGPLVSRINRRVAESARSDEFDLVWVDKGVYLWHSTVMALRQRAKRLVHFTPDTAFHANRSRHFLKTADKYDLLVTTKSFELDDYRAIAKADRIMLTTQAYDTGFHNPGEHGSPRSARAAFIGLCEPDREKCVEILLNADIPVRLGGQGWERFIRRFGDHPCLHLLDKKVFGEEYAGEYASASVGLGLLSKRFPELHTTRTFEIPACGALLATERTSETTRFFEEDEALFFHDYSHLAKRLRELLEQPDQVAEMAKKGRKRVEADGRDYESVLSGVLRRCELLK